MIGLSKSSLGIFKDCPRCFWLAKNKKIDRPRGIVASIINGVDIAMKQSVESAVVRGAPHAYLENVHGGEPFRDRLRLQKFMKWQTFQCVVDGVKLWGELDDLVEFPLLEQVAPWDFKSNGAEREWDEYVQKYYTLDGDLYHVILEEGQKLKCTGKAYFTFTWPTYATDNPVEFFHHTIEVDTDPARAVALAQAAVKCLEGPAPLSSTECEYCRYTAKVAHA